MFLNVMCRRIINRAGLIYTMIDLRKRKLTPLPEEYKNPELEGVLIPEREIRAIVKELANELAKEGKNWHCIIILNGAVFFGADLLRQIENCTFDTMQVININGKPDVKKPLSKELKDRDVLIIEDIIDSGQTMKFLIKHIRQQGAKSIKIISFLSKPERREFDVRLDYIGFIVPDKFLVGYGLDWNEKYRGLPFIASIREDR